MSKKRKTKKEKVIAQLRRQLSYQQTPSTETKQATSSYYSFSQPITPKQDIIKTTSTTKDYSYVARDMIKTVQIVSFLIAADFLLFFLIGRQIIKLSF